MKSWGHRQEADQSRKSVGRNGSRKQNRLIIFSLRLVSKDWQRCHGTSNFQVYLIVNAQQASQANFENHKTCPWSAWSPELTTRSLPVMSVIVFLKKLTLSVYTWVNYNLAIKQWCFDPLKIRKSVGALCPKLATKAMFIFMQWQSKQFAIQHAATMWDNGIRH